MQIEIAMSFFIVGLGLLQDWKIKNCRGSSKKKTWPELQQLAGKPPALPNQSG
jgi:hypothetical protein